MDRALCLAVLSLCACTDPAPLRPPPPDVSGSAALADPLRRGAWFIDEENDAVLLATTANGVHEYPCRWPAQVIADASGNLWAACRAEGVVRRFTAPQADWQVGPEPRALALDDQHRRLYVALATSNEVLMLDADTGVVLGRAQTQAEPTTLALLGRHLVVGSRKSSDLELFPRELGKRAETMRLYPEQVKDSLGVEHLVSARGSVVAIATVATLGDAAQPTYYGGGGFNSSPLVQQLFVLSPELQPVFAGAVALPDVSNAVFIDEPFTGGLLRLASRGAVTVTTVELALRPEHRGRGHRLSTWRALPEGVAGVADDGEQTWVFVDSMRSVLVAPSGSEVEGRELWSLRASTARKPKATAMGGAMLALRTPGSRLDPELALGRQLFHTTVNRRIAQAAIACANCHRDGRDDGRTWAGQGALRQTPLLAGRDIAHTAPYGWDGAYPTLEKYIAFTIEKRLRGTGLSEADLDALARYVREGLHRVERPATALSSSAAHGRKLFESDVLGCVSCHPADAAFTDGERHDVASISNGERDAWERANRFAAPSPMVTALDSPSLLGLGLSAPYLHDGSAKTLPEVFTRLGNHMGQVEQLSSPDRQSLAAYLATL